MQSDYFILVGYFVLMIGIGAYFYRYMKGMKDYFSGNNKIPWWLSGISLYMSGFSAFGFIAYSELAFKYGLVAISIWWFGVPVLILSMLLFARKWRRIKFACRPFMAFVWLRFMDCRFLTLATNS